MSVQEKLEDALTTFLQSPTVVVGCGRTDTGVHANQFFVNFSSAGKLSAYSLIHRLNIMLPKDIAVHKLFEVSKNFNARFDATWREYVYHIHFEKNPFLLNKSLYLPSTNLDINKMNQACEILLGEKDFTTFSKVKTQTKNNICNVMHAKFHFEEQNLIFTIRANRFLRNMVRAIVGTLLMVGNNKISLPQYKTIIDGKDRSLAGKSVDGCGLYLNKVNYPENFEFNG